MIRNAFLLLLVTALLAAPVSSAADSGRQTPRVAAALAQGRAAELGLGIARNPMLAMALYCDAGTMGSSDGFFQLGRMLATAPPPLRQPALANTYLALAARLGRSEALKYYQPSVDQVVPDEPCSEFAAGARTPAFDLDGYLARQPLAKQRVADLIRRLAPEYRIDARLALAIALAESNLDSAAVAPNNAQGVMQLIPATQRSYGLSRPFDAEQNVRAALAYLSRLDERYAGDWRLIATAYEAAEASVDRCPPPSPQLEARQYVRRVLLFAGFAVPEKVGAGGQAAPTGRSPATPGEQLVGRQQALPCRA
ncbi:MAG: lytic transglycosylase domain-containing protein [Candidatus Accumulibacter sp.]|uniref:lytic transglycosylase domain-containing protein n=1 Tax=Accumulibacter sp. TaxID=2053492 RepID=UPI0019F73A5B|nr:lytic transglycosylase domain-containing protein [Accumulibacter sp.]MBE2257331.1 lytic transglycosylase domain-containing protein [Paracoccaceae bacterium]MCB1942524.1 lytic transglycosylase domain-containing protein [Accumulibacter sp.]MCP5249293.1 lytic transglycosylase domain-containing protein [Accumulibacter sp.]